MPPMGFAEMKDKFLFWGVTAFICGSISWAAWVTMTLSSNASLVEYLKRREDRMEKVIERNTAAINGLKVEIAGIKKNP
jgi:hypothetical protein